MCNYAIDVFKVTVVEVGHDNVVGDLGPVGHTRPPNDISIEIHIVLGVEIGQDFIGSHANIFVMKRGKIEICAHLNHNVDLVSDAACFLDEFELVIDNVGHFGSQAAVLSRVHSARAPVS